MAVYVVDTSTSLAFMSYHHSQISLTRIEAVVQYVFFLYSADQQEHHRKTEVPKKTGVIGKKYQKVFYQALRRGKVLCCLRTKFCWENVSNGLQMHLQSLNGEDASIVDCMYQQDKGTLTAAETSHL